MRHDLPTTVVYVLGTLAIAYHLGNGLWSFAMGWGFAVSKTALAWMQRLAVAAFIVDHLRQIIVIALGPLGLAIVELHDHWSAIWGNMDTAPLSLITSANRLRCATARKPLWSSPGIARS